MSHSAVPAARSAARLKSWSGAAVHRAAPLLRHLGPRGADDGVRCGAEPTPVEAGRCRAGAGRNRRLSALLQHLVVRGAPERPGAGADGVPDGRRRPKAGVSSVPDVLTDCSRDPEQLVGAVPFDDPADSAAAHAGDPS